MTDLTTDAIKQPTCRKCGGTMQPGHALGQTYTSGAPDDLGGDAQTMSTNEMPERIWLDVESYNGAVGFAHAKRKDEGQWQEFFRADLCASGQRVRALEWGAEVKFSGQPAFYSDSEFGIGMIVDHSVHGNGIKAYDETGDSIGVFPDFDAAKAAAQADYERRILAALMPAPQPTPATPTAQETVLVALTYQQKLEALSLRFYQGMQWNPKAGDYYTTSRADLELYQVVEVENGTVKTRYCDQGKSDAVASWPVEEFTSAGFGPKRVYVPDFVLRAHPPQPSVSVAEAALKEARANMQHIKERIVGEWPRNGTLELIETHQRKIDAALRALKGGEA